MNGRKLIIDANSELELERYLKDSMSRGNRFKFIEKTDEISDYRGDRVDDGIVRIEYQFEQAPQPTFYYNSWDLNNTLYGSGRIGRGIDCCVGSSLTSNNAVYNCSVVNDNGITVPGSTSNQKFTEGRIGVLDPEKFVITLMLRGKTSNQQEVPMPITTALKKFKCQTCGRSQLMGKFCSNCGTSSNIF